MRYASVILTLSALAMATLVVPGCATPRAAMQLASSTLQNWEGDLSLTGPVRVEVGVGTCSEWYAYAQLEGLQGGGIASGEADDGTGE